MLNLQPAKKSLIGEAFLKFVLKMTIGNKEPEIINHKICRMTRYEEYYTFGKNSESHTDDTVTHHHNNDATKTIIIQP
jgi:hypothetical protein